MSEPSLVAAGLAGLVGGLALLARGFAGYRTARRIHSDRTSAAVRALFAVVERYPDLRSQDNILDLQDEIERLEAMIADRRELYNDQVYRHNTRIASVPTNLIAAIFGWRPDAFFAAEPAERDSPAIPPAVLDR